MLLFITVMINYLDRSNLSIVAGSLSHELQLTPRSLGLALSAFGWTYAFFQIPLSRLVDKTRPRYLMAAALGLWSLGTFLNGFVHHFAELILIRMFVGALEAPSYPINNRVVSTWFPESERASVIGFYTSGQFVGLAFLTPALAWLQVHFGWRAVFHFTGTIGLVWSVVWWLVYRNPPQAQGGDDGELDLIREDGGPPKSLPVAPSLSEPSVWYDLRAVLGRRQLWGIYIGQFGLNSTLWFFLTWFPSYLTQYRHVQFASAGMLASIPFIAAFFGVILGGILSDWLLRLGYTLSLSRKLPIVTGLLLASCIGFATRFSDIHVIIACMAISFFGCGFASITWSLVSVLAPPGLIGFTSGVFNFVSNCSAIAVPIVVGLLIKGENFRGPLLFISGMALVAILAYVFLVGEIQEPSWKTLK